MADICDVAAERIEESNERLRDKIKRLRDLPTNPHGICTRCGGDIERARLEANPWAKYCIDCALDLEEEERLLRKRGKK